MKSAKKILTLVAVQLAAPLAIGAVDSSPAKPNSQMTKILDELHELGGKPIDTLSATEARKQPTPADAVKQLLSHDTKSAERAEHQKNEGIAKTEDRSIPGVAGEIPTRIYWPTGKGPFPVTIYYHGGGWVIANKDVYDSSPRALASGAGTIVISVDYRQGPEHKFPAAHDDAYAAYAWALKNAASLNGKPNEVAVAGESAGGNLAVAVSMMARDKGVAMPVHELVVYPIASPKMDTPSYTENADAKPLNKPMMAWFFRNYLRTDADAKDPRIDLIDADLKGLPPTTLITAQIDPLRSEGEMLVKKMKEAGVKVDYKNYQGVTHEFFGMAAVLDQAKSAEKFAVSGLKKGFKE